MNADELKAELDRLWARVSDDSRLDDPPLPVPAASLEPALHTHTHEASLEVIHLLRRQRHEEVQRLQNMLALKERAVAELSERMRAAQAEVLELRRREQRGERQALSEIVEVSTKLEEAQKVLRQQEQRYADEEKILRDIAEKTREQLAGETARWRELERQWNAREQQYLIDLKEAQTLVTRAQEEAGRKEKVAFSLQGDIKQAKGAIEATLAELLSERKLREAADQERDKALQKVSEVEDHFQQLQRIWEEERKQWQELWDRERSSWDVQRQELSTWEGKLRREREAWHADLKAKEQQELRYREQVAATLRESSEASTRLAKILKVVTEAAGVPAGSGRKVWLAAGAVLAAAAVAVPVQMRLSKLRLVPEASHALTIESPTAVATDGSSVWMAEWSGNLANLDVENPTRVLSRFSVSGAGAYHPTALALSGEALWSLDTAQARILRHSLSDPSIPQDAWASPGPAPSALTHDGRNLWSYDAVTKTVYRHLGEGPQAEVNAFPLDLDVVPTSMQWAGDELWLHDSKGKRLLRLRLKGDAWREVGSTPCDPALLSVAVSKTAGIRRLWTLSGGAGGYFLKRFRPKQGLGS